MEAPSLSLLNISLSYLSFFLSADDGAADVSVKPAAPSILCFFLKVLHFRTFFATIIAENCGMRIQRCVYYENC